MSSLFSSPSKQAQAAAGAEAGLSNQEIQNLEGYVNQQQQQERGAIAGIGPNPYFKAAQENNPAGMAVNPGYTATFGNTGPGTTGSTNNIFQQGSPPAQAAPSAPAPVAPPASNAPTRPGTPPTPPKTNPGLPPNPRVQPQVQPAPVYNPNVRAQ